MNDNDRGSRGRLTETPDDGTGVFGTYWPLLAERRLSVLAIAVSSFGAGMAEAALLVVLANIALLIGGGGGSSVTAALGPFGSVSVSLSLSFAIAFALLAARALLSLWSASITARLTTQLMASIRSETFHDFFAASWAEQALRSESDVQDLLQRHVTRASSAVTQVGQAIGTACTMFALLISAFLVDAIAALLLIITGALLFLAIRPVSGLAKRLSKEQLLAGRDYARLSLEAISVSFEIRSFGVSDQVTRRLDDATLAEMRPQRRALVLRQVVATAYQTATILLLLLGLAAVHSLVERPLASLGAIVLLLIRSLNQAASLQGTYHSLVETAPYVHRLKYERLLLRTSLPDPGSVSMNDLPSLRFDSIGYSYGDGRSALTDVSFSVSRGEAIGIIGPSGSGKSTLIQLLLRLRQPDSGTYFVGDTDARLLDDTSWYSQIAFVPQDPRVIEGTVAENIAFFRCGVTRDEIIDAATNAHLHDEIMEMQNGYDTPLGSRGGALSGGQRQRICIARALLYRPTLLVMDEPTSALDLRSEALIHETMSELKGSVTMFTIAHRLSTLNSCDRILVLEHGRVEAFGTRAELEREDAFYRKALELSRIRATAEETIDEIA